METGPENWKNCSLEHLEKSRTHRVGSGGLLDMAGHDESPEGTEIFRYVRDFRKTCKCPFALKKVCSGLVGD